APFLLITRRVFGTDPVTKIHRSVHVAEETGAPLVVVHPPYRWQVRYKRWAERDLAEFSARTGVTVAVENMFPVKLSGERGLTVSGDAAPMRRGTLIALAVLFVLLGVAAFVQWELGQGSDHRRPVVTPATSSP